MELFVQLATVLTGVAVLVQFGVWLYKKKIREGSKDKFKNSRKKKAQIQNPKISLDLEFSIIESESQLESTVLDLLYFTRSNQGFEIEIATPQLEKFNNELTKLNQKKILSSEEREQRNTLHDFVSDQRKSIDKISRIIKLLFKANKAFPSNFFPTKDWVRMLKGIVEKFQPGNGKNPGTKIDLWKEKPNKIYSSLWVNDEELDAILKKLNLKHPQNLATGCGVYTAIQLPYDLISSKAVPAMIVSLFVFNNSDDIPENEIITELDLSSWYVGLG